MCCASSDRLDGKQFSIILNVINCLNIISKMNLELFIETIRKHPELYEKKNKNYMNINEKEKIWKELDKTYQIDGKVLEYFE